MAKRGGDKGVTIIKREEVVAGGHHGGAWKVAYADFVTAMMAFFLLMWLLNATTDKQRRGLADYFSPTTIQARGASGTGQPLGGKSVFEDGPAVSDRGTVSVMNEHAAPVDVEDDGSDTVATKVIHAEGQAADRDGSRRKPRTGISAGPTRQPWRPRRQGGRSRRNWWMRPGRCSAPLRRIRRSHLWRASSASI
jgi:chemotaxis protein MotB